MTSHTRYPPTTAVVNLKGGVGKTTVCVNLAYGLSYFKNSRVLLVDLDPQANATQYLISSQTYRKIYRSDPPGKLSVYELYNEHLSCSRLSAPKPVENPDRFLQRVFAGDKGYLDLLASKLELSMLAFEGGQVQKNGQIRWLIEAVANNYDHVLIDCPPTVSRMLIGGFEAAEYVLVPIKPDFLSTIGLPLLHQVITQVYPENIARRPEGFADLQVLGLVYSMVDSRLTMTQESIEDINDQGRRLGYEVFKSQISESTRFAHSSKHTLPIFRTEPKSKYASEIEALVNEYLEKLKQKRTQGAT